LSGLFLVSTAPTAPPSDRPNTTILDVSISDLWERWSNAAWAQRGNKIDETLIKKAEDQ
jgi:hypothetical protein